MHHPNPFDFVPLTRSPRLRPGSFYDDLGAPVTGYMDVSLKALTPVHVVGYLNPSKGDAKSYIYETDGMPCVPGSTIRGCLRSFVEALTAGWISQANEEYTSKKGASRSISFRTFEKYKDKKKGYTASAAVDSSFKPAFHSEGEIDLASYLFGMVIESSEKEDATHSDLARKSRIWIEDAHVEPEYVHWGKYIVPDIKGKSFMGGANPSASNWWYFFPEKIRKKTSNRGESAEFVGGRFRGRKFYFHQDPSQCLRYYAENWAYSRDPSEIKIECIEPERTCRPFRIYFEKIPRPLMALFYLVLAPGKHIRHKLGYGKAYGYGSVEFDVRALKFREHREQTRIPSRLEDHNELLAHWSGLTWDAEVLNREGLMPDLIDWEALNHLAKILSRENCEELIFVYPQFRPTEFKQVVKVRIAQDAMRNVGRPIHMNQVLDPVDARRIAERLWATKKTIHFELYQEKSKGWNLVQDRKP